MTTVQIGGVVVLAVVFFGSFTLGRFLRRLDDRKDAERVKAAITVHPIRPLHETDSYFASSGNPEELAEFRKRYFAEIDRLAWGYHGNALLYGERAATRWLREQTGRPPESNE